MKPNSFLQYKFCWGERKSACPGSQKGFQPLLTHWELARGIFIIPCLIWVFLFAAQAAFSANPYDIIHPDVSVPIIWTPATGNPEFYKVFVSDNGAGYVEVGTTQTTSYTLVSENQHIYQITVQAADSQGNEGPMSDPSPRILIDINAGSQNQSPVVDAGVDQVITLSASANLDGTVTDDGRPNPPGAVITTWGRVSGPGTVTVADANAIDTTASFSVGGSYVFELTANDSILSASDQMVVTVIDSPTPDLVAHWNFDESSGTTAVDCSGNGHNGVVNGPTWTSGQIGGALSFDGTNDYVDVGSLDVFAFGPTNEALTITAWIKADDFDVQDARIISKSTSSSEQAHYWMVSTFNNNGMKLRFRLKTEGTTTTLVASSGILSVGQWIHVVATYDGNTMKLYKDGVLVGSTSKTGAIDINAAVPVWIGNNPNGATSFPFDGLIDDVRIYSSALSETEIQTLANPGGGSMALGQPGRPVHMDN